MTDGSTPESIRRMIRRLAPVIYGPTVLFALGEGAVIPLLPIFAANLGADVPTAALVASALVVGQLFGNLPAGWAVARIGERVTMAVGGVVALLGVVGLALAGQATAASVVIAAKGILRFPELQDQRGPGQRIDVVTEYFLLGSFTSWLVALGCALLAL